MKEVDIHRFAHQEGVKLVLMGNGDWYPHEHELDALLMSKAMDVQREMKEVDKMVDPTMPKPKASLAAAKTEVHESTSDRAARYFATHGMKKVAHWMGDELSASVQAKLLKEQKQQAAPQDDLVMPEDDDEDAAYKKQWKKVDRLKRRSTLRR